MRAGDGDGPYQDDRQLLAGTENSSPVKDVPLCGTVGDALVLEQAHESRVSRPLLHRARTDIDQVGAMKRNGIAIGDEQDDGSDAPS